MNIIQLSFTNKTASSANIASFQVPSRMTIKQVVFSAYDYNALADNDGFSLELSKTPQVMGNNVTGMNTGLLAKVTTTHGFTTSGATSKAINVVIPMNETLQAFDTLYVNLEEFGVADVYGTVMVYAS